MCLLTYSPAGTVPKRKHLENSCRSNPHGFGYAILTQDKIIVGKGLDYKKIVDEYLALKKQYPNTESIFHSRYATHGEMNEANCHPFFVGNDNQTVIAHNGILDIPTYDNRSDTRVFVEDLFPTYDKSGGLDNPLVFNGIEQWAVGSKMVVLTLNPKYKYNVYIINEKLGHYDKKGIWWSNYGYCDAPAKPASTSAYAYEYYSYEKGYHGKEEYVYVCPNCDTEIDDSDLNEYDMLCTKCNFCLGCLEDWQDCLCWEKSKYNPTSKKEQEIW